MRDQCVLFEEINALCNVSATPSILPETVIGLCQIDAEFVGYQSQTLCRTCTVGRHFVRQVPPKFLTYSQFAYTV